MGNTTLYLSKKTHVQYAYTVDSQQGLIYWLQSLSAIWEYSLLGLTGLGRWGHILHWSHE